MKIDKRIVAAIVLAFVLGYWWSGSRQEPWTPHKDRPWLTWIAGAAKRLLWIAIVADPPPADTIDEPAEARVGDDGYRLVQHKRGW